MSDTTLKNFVIDGSDRSVQDIVSKLKFIAQIQEGDVVDVRSLTLMKKSWGTSAYRTFFARDEGKSMTLEFFRSVIGEAFSLSSEYLKQDEPFLKEIGDMIIRSLSEAKCGLDEYIKTNSKCHMHIAQIQTLIETLNTKITDLNRVIL